MGNESAKGLGRGGGRMVGREEGEDGLTNFESFKDNLLQKTESCGARKVHKRKATWYHSFTRHHRDSLIFSKSNQIQSQNCPWWSLGGHKDQTDYHPI